MGQARYPGAKRLMITADGGGANGARVRLWKIKLQKLVDEIAIPVTVCHLPPGTSKWNKIEHRLFAFITKNWRGKPLVQPSRYRPADRRHNNTQRSPSPRRARHQYRPRRHQSQ